MKNILFILLALIFHSCSEEAGIIPDYVLSAEQKHNKFSSAIPPVIRVPSGSIIKVDTHEASDGQLHRNANIDDLKNIDLTWTKEKIERHIRATYMPGFEHPFAIVNKKKIYFDKET